jgi:hypothetical protein
VERHVVTPEDNIYIAVFAAGMKIKNKDRQIKTRTIVPQWDLPNFARSNVSCISLLIFAIIIVSN